jgi:hypothetical protein
MDVMDFEVLPGPLPAELARTALASAATAEIDDARRPGDPASRGRVPVILPVRDGRDGSPLLLSVTGSVSEHRLSSQREAVTVAVPAGGPYSTLRLTGTARPTARNRRVGIAACLVDPHGADLPLRIRAAQALADPAERRRPAGPPPEAL